MSRVPGLYSLNPVANHQPFDYAAVDHPTNEINPVAHYRRLDGSVAKDLMGDNGGSGGGSIGGGKCGNGSNGGSGSIAKVFEADRELIDSLLSVQSQLCHRFAM
jgi:hypothetical protein